MTRPDRGIAAYDAVAAWYDSHVRRSVLHREILLPRMLKLCGTVGGLDLLDVACGQGVMTRALAEAGARAHGVDLSAALLDIARATSRAPATYALDDAQVLASIADASYDGVTCCMGLGDVRDLAAVLTAVGRVLRPRGWFVLSITHPCFQTPDSSWEHVRAGTRRVVAAYFREGRWASGSPDGVRGRVGAEHRTLSTLLNTIIGAGFALEHVTEPRATAEVAVELPGYDEVPAVLMIRCRADAPQRDERAAPPLPTTEENAT